MEIAYQAIVNLSDGALVGHEALARFEDGVTPDQAFKQAWDEGNGVELEIEAIDMALRNFPYDIHEGYLAVNASAQTIIARRGEIVKDPGLDIPWPRIVVEISEKDKVDDYPVLDQCLSLLRQRKTRIAIDDGGAGYSGIRHILQILPDILKIDKLLVEHLDENPVKRAGIRSLVGLARDLRSTVVAEGIETQAEYDCCLGLGVDCGQGYLIGKPILSCAKPAQQELSIPK